MSEYSKKYHQSEKYKEFNKARQKEYYHSEEGHKAEAERRKNPRIRYSKAKHDAARRKSGTKDFTLSLEEYLKIIDNPCYYCLADITNETGSGLDRMDNDLGYIPGNVVPCCKECNRIRSKSMSSEEFLRQTILNGRRKS